MSPGVILSADDAPMEGIIFDNVVFNNPGGLSQTRFILIYICMLAFKLIFTFLPLQIPPGARIITTVEESSQEWHPVLPGPCLRALKIRPIAH